MIAASSHPKWLTVSAVADELGVSDDMVRSWVASGQLRAVDASARPGGKARWRIARTELDRFLLCRQAAGPVPRTPRPRRSRPIDVIPFF